jgi:hypothetical protein
MNGKLDSQFVEDVRSSYSAVIAAEVEKELTGHQTQNRVTILSKVLARHQPKRPPVSKPLNSTTVPMTYDPTKRRTL